jgi:hypothetical protein
MSGHAPDTGGRAGGRPAGKVRAAQVPAGRSRPSGFWRGQPSAVLSKRNMPASVSNSLEAEAIPVGGLAVFSNDLWLAAISVQCGIRFADDSCAT